VEMQICLCPSVACMYKNSAVIPVKLVTSLESVHSKHYRVPATQTTVKHQGEHVARSA
jgi:hypothetical protein